VHYTVQGAGPTIIFVHGWTCDETSWLQQAPAFAGKYRVITMDLPGHGKSEAPPEGGFSMNLFAEAVEAVRAATGAERVVLVGHSMGAVVIRQYGLNYPGHVAGLVAVDGPLDIRSIATPPASMPPMTPEARRDLVGRMFVPETPEPVREHVRDMMLGAPEATAVGASTTMFDSVNLSDQTISAPALTIYAGQSLFPPDQKTKELLTNWEAVQIEGTGHFLMMEKPDAFNRLLAAFLSDRARY
jgi:pimeloyl-ACP methyl ester carboxylesterase